MNVDITDLKTVRLSQDGSAVIILDQTCLPGSEVYVSLSSAEEIWEATNINAIGSSYPDSRRPAHL